MEISPKQPTLQKRAWSGGWRGRSKREKRPFLLEMFILPLVESKGIVYVIVCFGAQFYFIFLNIHLFIYLAASGLSCGMRDLLVAAHGLLVAAPQASL